MGHIPIQQHMVIAMVQEQTGLADKRCISVSRMLYLGLGLRQHRISRRFHGTGLFGYASFAGVSVAPTPAIHLMTLFVDGHNIARCQNVLVRAPVHKQQIGAKTWGDSAAVRDVEH